MNEKIKPKDLRPLARFINTEFSGNLFEISTLIDKAVYMFHYLPEDSFEATEVQDVCYTLTQIRESLFQAHQSKEARSS